MAVFFRKDIEPQCAYCTHGTASADKSSVLCRKAGGVMQPCSHCRKFSYDPLKREPRIFAFSSDFSKDDFTL